MKAFLRLSALCILFACLVNAQSAIVTRNVILRAKATTSSENLDTLKPKAKLTLIMPAARNGFLHVQTKDGDMGCVYAKNVEVSDDEDAAEAGAPVEDESIAKLLGPWKSIQSQESKLRKTGNGSTWVNRSERDKR